MKKDLGSASFDDIYNALLNLKQFKPVLEHLNYWSNNFPLGAVFIYFTLDSPQPGTWRKYTFPVTLQENHLLAQFDPYIFDWNRLNKKLGWVVADPKEWTGFNKK